MEINDFGFTLVGEEKLIVPNNDKAEQLRDMIMPLLNNLKKNPEKDYIQWPGKDRVKRINEFIDKMNHLIENTD